MKQITLGEEQLKEIVTQAHMEGQIYNGSKHPSYGDAIGYFLNEVLKNLPNEPRTVSNNEQGKGICPTCGFSEAQRLEYNTACHNCPKP